MSVTFNYRQAKALVEYFEANKFTEDDNLEDALAVICAKESFPLLEGPEGLYMYDPEYPDEGLIYLG